MIRYILVLAILFTALLPPGTARAQETTCMPEIMSVIESVARLEMQREITQNQNLIAKPDSILEYSCFEQHLTVNGEVNGLQFSENESYFGINDAFIDTYSLDRAIYYLVFEALVQYLQANFWHKYLGDRADLEGLPTAGNGFTCYAMGYVWNKAKCMNFISPRDEQDGFYTFQEYADMSEDPRNLPDPQVCNAWPEWANEIADANRMNAETTGGGGNTELEDPLSTFPDMFAVAACGEPVPTGVYIPPILEPGGGVSREGYDEHVCLDPGCYYDGDSCTR